MKHLILISLLTDITFKSVIAQETLTLQMLPNNKQMVFQLSDNKKPIDKVLITVSYNKRIIGDNTTDKYGKCNIHLSDTGKYDITLSIPNHNVIILKEALRPSSKNTYAAFTVKRTQNEDTVTLYNNRQGYALAINMPLPQTIEVPAHGTPAKESDE